MPFCSTAGARCSAATHTPASRVESFWYADSALLVALPGPAKKSSAAADEFRREVHPVLLTGVVHDDPRAQLRHDAHVKATRGKACP